MMRCAFLCALATFFVVCNATHELSVCEDANALGRFGPSRDQCPSTCKWTNAVWKKRGRRKRLIKKAICEDMPLPPSTCDEANTQQATREVCESVPGGCLYIPAKRRRRRIVQPAVCTNVPPPEEMANAWERCSFEHGYCIWYGEGPAHVRFGYGANGKFITLGDVKVSHQRTEPIACTAEAFGVEELYRNVKTSMPKVIFACQHVTRESNSGVLTVFGENDGASGGTFTLTSPSIVRYIKDGEQYGLDRVFDSGLYKCTPSTFAAPNDTPSDGASCSGWEVAPPSDNEEGSPFSYFNDAMEDSVLWHVHSDRIATGPLGIFSAKSEEACARLCLGFPTCKSFTFVSEEADVFGGDCHVSAYASDSSSEVELKSAPSSISKTYVYREVDRTKWTAEVAAETPTWCAWKDMRTPLAILEKIAVRKPSLLMGIQDPCQRWRIARPGSKRGCGLFHKDGSVTTECGFCGFTPLSTSASEKSEQCTKLNFAQAEATCKMHGARLCTVEEIMDGAGRNTGCGLNFHPIWVTGKSAECGRNKEGTMQGGGYIPYSGSGKCASARSKRYFRCCQPPSSEGAKSEVKSVFTAPRSKISPSAAVVELAAPGVVRTTSASDTVSIPITVQIPSTRLNAPLDLLLLQDLSASFADDIIQLRQKFDEIIAGVKEQTDDVQFGLASFVDKPLDPYGDVAVGDYVYQLESALSKDISSFQAAITSLQTKFGKDLPESSLEALMMSALRTSETGWRTHSNRIVVIATDAGYHKAGDAPYLPANNYDESLDGYPAGTGEDYPSEDRVGEILAAAGIVPVFLVSCDGDCYQSYVDLTNRWGNGHVKHLASDSSDIVGLMKDSIEGILSEFRLSVASDKYGVVTSLRATDCGPDGVISGATCSGIAAGSTVHYELNFVESAPEDFEVGATVGIVSLPDYGNLDVAVNGGTC